MAKVSANNAIPIMTSNTAPSGIASASSMYNTSYDAWRALNNSATSYWQSANVSFPSWIAYEFDRPKQIVGYRLTTGNVAYSPKEWVFEGSNDNVNWVKLDTQTNVSGWIVGVANSFYFENSTYYKKYRLNISKNNYSSGSVFYIYLQELAMFELEYENKFLLKSSSGEVNGFVKGNENSYSDNLIPNMTSNIAPSGVASASSIWSTSYSPYYAFDNIDAGNGWLSRLTADPTPWLAYEFPTPKVIAKYSLINTTVTRSPVDWTFEGSNNETWTVLDTRSGVTDWVSNIAKEYTFENKIPYLKYRINITKGNGDASYIGIGEMKMMEVAIPKVVSYPKKLTTSLREQDFINHGIDDISLIVSKEVIEHKGYMTNQSTILGTGKTFENEIDLDKYKAKKIIFQ